MIRRRELALAAGATAVLWPLSAGAQSASLPVMPLSIWVGVVGGRPVVSDHWLRGQLHEAAHLMSPHGIFVRMLRRRELPEAHAVLPDALARDALASLIEPRVINVFIVDTLYDVDNPGRLRMGVRWRLRRDVRKDYVIVAARAMSTTLTHELGHFFGNGHSDVKNNIMSYQRDDPSEVAFDQAQGRKMRQVARSLLSSGKLARFDDLLSAG